MSFPKTEKPDTFFDCCPLRLQPLPSIHPAPFASRKYKYLYYSIPKNGCTTVKAFIYEQTHGKQKNLGLHAVRYERIKFQDIEKQEYRDYFSFAFTRNPWDRIVSCYFSKIKNPALERVCAQGMVNGESCFFIRRYGHCGFRYMTFDDFVQFVSRVPDWASDHHFLSQHCFINQKHLKFTARFENFHKDFSSIVKHIDQRYNIENLLKKKLMSSRHHHYTTYYTNKTRRLIEERYKKDIEMFSYKFGD